MSACAMYGSIITAFEHESVEFFGSVFGYLSLPSSFGAHLVYNLLELELAIFHVEIKMNFWFTFKKLSMPF